MEICGLVCAKATQQISLDEKQTTQLFTDCIVINYCDLVIQSNKLQYVITLNLEFKAKEEWQITTSV